MASPCITAPAHLAQFFCFKLSPFFLAGCDSKPPRNTNSVASDHTIATIFYVNGKFVPPWKWASTQQPSVSREWAESLSQLRLREINLVYVQWRRDSDANIRENLRSQLDDLVNKDIHNVIRLGNKTPIEVLWRGESHIVVRDGVDILYTDLATFINAIASVAEAQIKNNESIAVDIATILLNFGYVFHASDASLETERARLIVLDIAWSRAIAILQMIAEAEKREEESRHWQSVAAQFVDLMRDLKRVNIRRRGGE